MNLTISRVHQGLLKKEFSALELTKGYLKTIREKDKKISAFLNVFEKSALAQAKKIDELLFQGQKISMLAGVPMAVKDNILVQGEKCTAGSKILENYIAPYDATVIKKLKEQQAIILGKGNMDEFGMGSSGENSAFGPTKNPHDLTRVPGGTSSGPAAAVAADMSIWALASDTGGSVRQPAGFCGVVGLKPTYGAVSRYGLMATASSLDQIGSLTKTVRDARIVFDAIAGKDEMDSTSVEFKKQETRNKKQTLKIGIPKEYFVKGMDSQVEKIIKSAIKRFEDLGAKIVEISLPHTKYALACYYIIMPSEVSANLARYDGVKYGLSVEGKNLLDVYLRSRRQGFGEEARRRIMLGTYTLSAGYYDAYYIKAQKVRTLIKQDFEKAFGKVDIVLTPVSPTPAFKIGEKITDPLKMHLSDILTVSVNLAGLPGISIPAGEVKGLPVGVQLIGRPFEENVILEAGEAFEQI